MLPKDHAVAQVRADVAAGEVRGRVASDDWLGCDTIDVTIPMTVPTFASTFEESSMISREARDVLNRRLEPVSVSQL